MKVAIIDELHDIKRSGVYFSTEALKEMFNENDIDCEIFGIKKRGKVFNFVICVPFLRELIIFPLWNRLSVKRISSLGYNVAFYQCSTSLMFIKRTPFKRVVYTRALLARRLRIYSKLNVTLHIKLIVHALYPMTWLVERLSFKNADRIVASKKRFAEYIAENFKIEASRFKVVPQMINLNINNDPSKKKYDLLFIGRLSIPKNWPLIIDIANKSNLKIAAATPEMETPENVPKNIHVFNRVPYKELSGLIRSAKIFIMPSFNEEGPRVTLEAMACGLPVVASLEGSGEFVKHGVNGLEVESNNTEDYLEAIDTLLTDPILYEKISTVNPSRAAQFTPEKLAKEYISALTF